MKVYSEVELNVMQQAFCKTNHQDFRHAGGFGSDDELTALTAQAEMLGLTLLDTDSSMNLETKWRQSLQTGEGGFPQSLYLLASTSLVKPDRSLDRSVDQGLRSPRYLRPNSLVNKNKTGRSFHLKL